MNISLHFSGSRSSEKCPCVNVGVYHAAELCIRKHTQMFAFIALLVALLLYFILAPFFIEIDSTRSLLRLRFHYLASAAITANKDSIFLRFRIAFLHKNIDLLKAHSNRKSTSIAVKTNTTRTKKVVVPSAKQVISVLRSFRVQRCHISIDTGSMPLNGVSYPGLYCLSMMTGKHIMINFTGENIVILKIRNNIGNMLWAFLRPLLSAAWHHHNKSIKT